jgi:hypothetical protein
MAIEPAPAPLRADDSGCFEHRTTQRARFPVASTDVVRRLHDVAEWPAYLPHVLEIDLRYDDGRYQEFIMVVASETGGDPLRVRSIRNCREREIEFFQPEPPPFLLHHAGVWRFFALDDGCEVEVTHVWNLRDDVAGAMFPPTPDASTEEQVRTLLAGHSRLTLQSWQRVLGGEG